MHLFANCMITMAWTCGMHRYESCTIVHKKTSGPVSRWFAPDKS